jgi:hypothetical protein
MIKKMPPSPGVLDDIPISPCVRSGFCCKQFPCSAGQHYGADYRGPCKFLRGDEPGAYSCGLLVDGVIVKEDIHAGAGCCSPAFNEDRNNVVRRLRNEAKKQNPAPTKGSSSQEEE